MKEDDLKPRLENDIMNKIVDSTVTGIWSVSDNYVKLDNAELFMRSKQFKEITEELQDIYYKKNKDYGSSVTDTYKKFGLTSFLVRLTDKLNRLVTLNSNKEIMIKDEKIEDTLMDMANYCILALIELRNDSKGEKNEK